MSSPYVNGREYIFSSFFNELIIINYYYFLMLLIYFCGVSRTPVQPLKIQHRSGNTPLVQYCDFKLCKIHLLFHICTADNEAQISS